MVDEGEISTGKEERMSDVTKLKGTGVRPHAPLTNNSTRMPNITELPTELLDDILTDR